MKFKKTDMTDKQKKKIDNIVAEAVKDEVDYDYYYFKTAEEQEYACQCFEKEGYCVSYCSNGDDLGVEVWKED